MREQKFFRCKQCGNLIGLINDGGMPIICCGEPMEELLPNTVEAATEKHIPEVSVKERLVHAKIGSVAHPMTEEHHIDFIYLLTENGGQIKRLKVGTEAAAIFAVLNDKPLAVYAYCNLHGLWKVDVTCDCSSEHTAAGKGNTDETICSAEFPQSCI